MYTKIIWDSLGSCTDQKSGRTEVHHISVASAQWIVLHAYAVLVAVHIFSWGHMTGFLGHDHVDFRLGVLLQ